ncbi:MAG TPA: Gfo/Idh/MocA family oxidoreductase, partial [Opitutaceae bacterium]
MSNATSSGYGLSAVGAADRLAAPSLPYQPPVPRTYRPGIGLIGCGGISEYHLRAYRSLGLDVVALCDPSVAKAEKRRFGFFPDASVYSDAHDVLARPDIAVVDIATHPAERAVLIEAALAAGKHVLSQKPFALDLATATRLAALADARGLRLAVNQNGRWAPHFSYLRHAVDAGLIGDVASVDFTVQWDHTWTAGTPFEAIHHLVLYDFAVHWFDIATVLLGGRRARRVMATVARTGFQTVQPPFLAQAIADYDDAQVRFAFNAHVRHGQEDRTVVCGSLGTLRSFGPSLTQQTVTLHRAEGDASPHLVGNWFENGFQGTMGELLCAIEEDREPSNSARNNLRTLELCFAAIASADAGGQPVVPGTVTALPVR